MRLLTLALAFMFLPFCSARRPVATPPSPPESASETTEAGPSRPYRYVRRYEPGRRFRYRQETRHWTNSKLDSVHVATSHHEVLRGAVARERVRWEDLEVTRGDKTASQTALAAAIEPYEISLHPDGSLALPPLREPAMVGPISDLTTFYVAISPSIGIDTLTKVGDEHVMPEAVRGVWTVLPHTPLGEDCIVPRVKITHLDVNTVTFHTAFEPPSTPCLEPLGPWMREPVDGTRPNNFRQVTADPSGTRIVMWGREAFTTECRVERPSGRILVASMENTLTLKVRVGCDATLESCAGEFPTTIRRTVKLKLLPAPPP